MPYSQSIKERPVLRVRFTTPEGQAQQTTISTTHILGFRAVDLSQAPETVFAAQALCSTVARHIREMHEAMGCTVEGIDLVGVVVHEF